MRLKFNGKKYCKPCPKAFLFNGIRMYDGINNIDDQLCEGEAWDRLLKSGIIEILEDHPQAPKPRKVVDVKPEAPVEVEDLASSVKEEVKPKRNRRKKKADSSTGEGELELETSKKVKRTRRSRKSSDEASKEGND